MGSAPGPEQPRSVQPRPVQRHFAASDDGVMRAPRSASGAPAGGEALNDFFSAAEIYKRVAATADAEFQRNPRMLFFSGIAAGLSLGITFLGRAALGAATGGAGSITADLLYPIGFIVVVVGRYQLFSENTLTPVTLVLARLASIPSLLRLWGVVLVANLLGAATAALLVSVPGAMEPAAAGVAATVAREALNQPLGTLLVRSAMAGGIVATMVWLVHAVREGIARVAVVFGLMFLVPVAGLYHCITGFVEVTYGVLHGEGSVPEAAGFLCTVAFGNILGGVLLVAVVNYGQTAGGERDQMRLGWRQFVLGHNLSRHRGEQVAPELDPERDPNPAD